MFPPFSLPTPRRFWYASVVNNEAYREETPSKQFYQNRGTHSDNVRCFLRSVDLCRPPTISSFVPQSLTNTSNNKYVRVISLILERFSLFCDIWILSSQLFRKFVYAWKVTKINSYESARSTFLLFAYDALINKPTSAIVSLIQWYFFSSNCHDSAKMISLIWLI